MPPICEYKCNRCGFSLPKGWGYCFYVLDDKGNRILCGHPSERLIVWQVLGRYVTDDYVISRSGFISNCLCLKCLHQFKADLGSLYDYWSPFELSIPDREPGKLVRQPKDPRLCPKCGSTNVKMQAELVGEPCPKCKKGIIEEIPTGAIS